MVNSHLTHCYTVSPPVTDPHVSHMQLQTVGRHIFFAQSNQDLSHMNGNNCAPFFICLTEICTTGTACSGVVTVVIPAERFEATKCQCSLFVCESFCKVRTEYSMMQP